MKTKEQLSEADINFLREVNNAKRGIPVTETLKAKYIRQFDRPILKQMEDMAKRVIRPDFILCYHCPNEVYSMVEKLYGMYTDQQPEPDPAEQPVPSVKLGEDEHGNEITETVTVEPPAKTHPTKAAAKPKGKPGRKPSK